MKWCVRYSSTVALALVLAVLPVAFFTQASPMGSPAKGAARTSLIIPTVPEVAIPQSAFAIPSQPSEGRNPFFPQSTVRVVIPKPNKENSAFDASLIVLNGITSPPRPTAMINGRTFEPGEEAEVKLAAGGKQLIKCEEIKADSAIILINGQRRELRLRSGL